MLRTSAPDRKADVYGVTTSSLRDWMTVYLTPGTVSPPALSPARNGEPLTWSAHAGHVAPGPWSAPGRKPASVARPSSVVPWLEGASPTSAPTLAAPPRFLR